MVILKLQGGLGNQMFQYAIGRIVAEKNEVDLLLDNSFFEDQEKKTGFTPRQFELEVFKPKYRLADKKIVKSFFTESQVRRLRKYLGLSYKKVYREEVCYFDISILSLSIPVYLDGYFQSEKYFKGNESLIKNIFDFPHLEGSYFKEILQSIKIEESVSVHFRRGDYIQDEVIGNFHGICTLDYYKNAIGYMIEELKSPHFFVFSDDIDWVEQQLSGLVTNITFVKGNSDSKSWTDMMLMSNCKHHIIANSSYSWWGAWLNQNPDKIVIAPKKWFNDPLICTKNLVPESWIRI
jgi:hypothetical protein